MALAGFGLFGVMTKVRLRLVPSKEWVTMHSLTFETLEEAWLGLVTLVQTIILTVGLIR